MENQVQKLLTYKPEVEEKKISASHNIVKKYGKKALLILTSIWVIWWWTYYVNSIYNTEHQFPSSIDTNSTNNKKSLETEKIYDNLTIIYDLAKLFEEKWDLNKVLFSQEDLDNILVTYSKTKDNLWKNMLKVVHSILKNMIINILKEWYHITWWHKELDILKENITIFSGGEINIRYSQNMPKNPEFEGELTIKWDLDSNNTLTIKKATKIDTILEYFDTNDNILKYPRIFELFEAFYKDLPKWYIMLSDEANKSNLESMEYLAYLVEAKSKISTLETIINRLNEEKTVLRGTHKEEIQDLKDEHDIVLQKNKKNTTDEIERLNIRHYNETDELEKYIKIMTDELESYKALIENWEKKFKETVEELYSKIKIVNNAKSLLESKIDAQSTKIIDLTKTIKEEKEEKKKIKEELSILENDQNTLLNTMGINKSQRITKIAKLKKELSAKKLSIKNLSTQILKEKEINDQLTEQWFISLTLSKILSNPTIENINNNINIFKKEIFVLKEKIKNIKTSEKDKKEFKLRTKALNQIIKFLEEIKSNNWYKNKLEKESNDKELLNLEYIKLSSEFKELQNKNSGQEKTIKTKNSIIEQLNYTLKWVSETLSFKAPNRNTNTYKDKILEKENSDLITLVQEFRTKIKNLEKEVQKNQEDETKRNRLYDLL